MDKKILKAAAIKYRHIIDDAPSLVARGSGKFAEELLKIASEHGIPITEDTELIELLSMLDLYQDIPPEMYKAVSEILLFVYIITTTGDPDDVYYEKSV